MKRRSFLKTLGNLVAGAFVSNVARLYAPSEPWSVAVPKPLDDFVAFVEAIRGNDALIDGLERAAIGRNGGFLIPKHISDEIYRALGPGGNGTIVAPWGSELTAHWGNPGPGDFNPQSPPAAHSATSEPCVEPAYSRS